ncbi:MAG TPA: 3-oxoacyl-ACP reductase family protein [Terriglobia bacterium]|nr:3-oxoacyl-ACP reductase family protein [Terriglobia bacterium]
MNQSLTHRVALVTGGSRGIGRATCFELAARGARVAVAYRKNAQGAEEVAGQIRSKGGRAIALQADHLDPSAAQRAVNQVVTALGPIDILVNNAGEMTDVSVAHMKDEQWEESLAINLTGPFRFTRECLPGMKERRWGRIIIVSSQVVYTGSANHAHYTAAKAGLLGFAFSLVKEVGSYGITVNVVAPGRITTDLLLERMAGREEEWMKQTPMRRFGRPEEVAAAIAFLATEDASYITGAVLNVNGGLVMG